MYACPNVTRTDNGDAPWTPWERDAWERAQHRSERLVAHRRREHGVVHTPPGMARSVLAWVDRHLRTVRGLERGLSDPRVWLVDPACGTGAFVAAALAVAGETGLSAGAPSGVFCADIDMGALEAARAALASPLAERDWPARFHHGDALQISPEALLASRDKRCIPVVVGNPPWSVAATQLGTTMSSLLKDFQRLPDGSGLGERKLGVLRDRYVLFVRWAIELARLAETGGVVAMVLNGSFLDGPVHRGMRAALATWCGQLDIVDLGGNAMLTRSGDRDDNVFGVRPSVAVMLADCSAKASLDSLSPSADRARVAYRRLWGDAGRKLAALNDVVPGMAGVPRMRLSPPAYRFAPPPPTAGLYASFVALPDMLPFHREGVQTNRDAVAIADSPGALIARLHDFVGRRADPALAAADKPLSHYDPERARARVAQALAQDPEGRLGVSVRALAYRRGEVRYVCPVAPFCHRPRPALLSAMVHAQAALATARKDRGSAPWRHAAGLTLVPDSSFLSARSSCRTRAFPSHGPDGTENLDAEIAARMVTIVGAPVGVLDVLAYALAVLSAPIFVAAFDADLRLDYPRVPLPDTAERFRRLAHLGRGLLGPAGVPLSDQVSLELDSLMAPAWLP